MTWVPGFPSSTRESGIGAVTDDKTHEATGAYKYGIIGTKAFSSTASKT